MRHGVRLGIDVGSVRVGVAACDPSGLLASPVETVSRDVTHRSDLRRIVKLVEEYSAIEVVVGAPTSLSGLPGPAFEAAHAYAVAVSQSITPVPVRMVDERFSTVTAHRALGEAGVKGRRRKPVVDQVAAVVILQAALDAERVSGRPPGTLITRAGADDEGK
jgi:putative Holliday junction resolvase